MFFLNFLLIYPYLIMKSNQLFKFSISYLLITNIYILRDLT